MLAIVRNLRDFREFVAAKKRKREPLRIIAKPVARASYVPRDSRCFARMRASLRGVGDWGRASERLDALEYSLKARHGVTLPLPRKLMQNEDRSLTVFWKGASVRCFQDGFVSTIGGVEGIRAKRVTAELLDTLAFLMRIQSS